MIIIRPTRRRGFSLVEILVVMGVMALLAAIAVGAYVRASAGQYKSNTESTLNKLATLLEKKRAAVVRQATSETVPTAVRTFADNDPDRARTIWVYMRLKQEFPTSRTEGTTDISCGLTGTGLPLKPRTPFSKIATGAGIDAYEESAACLYMILNESAASGETASQDGLQNKVIQTPGGNTVYKDEWSRPIPFFRMAYAAEVDATPYIPGGAARPASLDPLDPKGRLNVATAGWTLPTSLNTFWPAITAGHIDYTGFPMAAYPGPGRNWLMAVVSGGADKTIGAAGTPLGSPFGTDDPAADNLVSYRLRANIGKRGD